MKKILSLLLSLSMLALPLTIGYAAEGPTYDKTYNNNLGALFANGVPITIEETAQGTVARWDGGSQELPATATVFGGGRETTAYPESSITMNGGTVSHIYGGGLSIDETKPSYVGASNVVINNGNVTGTVYGGALLYGTVNDANVTINDGDIRSASGGGAAAATISGVSYSSGTEEKPENSGTRTNNALVTVNGGSIEDVWGGGQGYSATESAQVIVNDGDIGYLTAGGSNGYTGNSDVKINGGDIDIYQSINRGKMNSATVTVDGGTVTNLNVGGENAPDVTGKINIADANILSGEVSVLNPGISNGVTLDFTTPNYNAVYVNGTVAQKTIPTGSEAISFKIGISPDYTELNVGMKGKLKLDVTTSPEGYEYLFAKSAPVWESENEAVAAVSQDGIVTGVSEGNTIINATLSGQTASAEVEVTEQDGLFVAATLIILVALLAFAIALIL